MKMGLFIVAVALTILCISVAYDPKGQSRALMELPSAEDEPIKFKKIELAP